MVEYRLRFNDEQYRRALKRYEKHVDAYGGLFVSDKRNNLLGKNSKNPQPFKDTPSFWSDVKKSVRNGLVDLQLVCAVASNRQKKKMFEYIPAHSKEMTGGFLTEEEFNALSPNLSSVVGSVLAYKMAEDKEVDDMLWRADLAIRIIDKCLGFFQNNNIILSPIHQRQLDEVKTILQVELNRYVH